MPSIQAILIFIYTKGLQAMHLVDAAYVYVCKFAGGTVRSRGGLKYR